MRSVLVVLAMVAGVGAAGGCARSEVLPADLLAVAQEATTDAGTARIEFSGPLAESGSDTSSVETVVDFGARALQYRITLPDGAREPQGSVGLPEGARTPPPHEELGGEAVYRFINGSVYANIGGTGWILAGTGAAAEGPFFGTLVSGDPGLLITRMQASGTITETPDRLDGADVVRYAADIPAGDLIDIAADLGRGTDVHATDLITVELAVDTTSGVIRQMGLSLDPTRGFTVTYTDFGGPDPLTVPEDLISPESLEAQDGGWQQPPTDDRGLPLDFPDIPGVSGQQGLEEESSGDVYRTRRTFLVDPTVSPTLLDTMRTALAEAGWTAADGSNPERIVVTKGDWGGYIEVRQAANEIEIHLAAVAPE